MWRKSGPEGVRETGYAGEDRRGSGGRARRRWSGRRVLWTGLALDAPGAFTVWAIASHDGSSSDDAAKGVMAALEVFLGLGLLSTVVAGPIMTIVGIIRLRAERTRRTTHTKEPAESSDIKV